MEGSCTADMSRIAVVIPCYKVIPHIVDVVKSIDRSVWRIYVIDDNCPDGTGEYIKERCHDSRLVVLYHKINKGVGGAVMTGYQEALADGADVIVKVDGDGQMDTSLLHRFVAPILKGQADYTKGNRFYDLTRITSMPPLRLLGNAVLSFVTKISSGYWSVFDPTNGFTAIHANIAAYLPLEKMNNRYFFETDMLFRLNTIRAVVLDIPMDAVYRDEKSNMNILKILFEFPYRHLCNFTKRILYNYFLRDMTLASIELVVGAGLLIFGVIFGGVNWFNSASRNILTPLGTIMLSALPVILGIQFLLAFLGYDIANVPKRPINNDLPNALSKLRKKG